MTPEQDDLVLQALRTTRAADRKIMAQYVHDLAIECGVEAAIKQDFLGRKRSIAVHITHARGARVTVNFNGDSAIGPECWVLSWHMDIDTDACFADVFGYDAVNRFHFHKATQVVHDFEPLVTLLRRILPKLVDGSAYSVEREAAGIAKRGETALERKVRLDRVWDKIKESVPA